MSWRSATTVTLGIGLALASTAMAQEPFTFVAMGDMPYQLPDDYARFERLITAVNQVEPAFTIHIGDTKSGSSSCADETLQKVRGYFDDFRHPLVYTPGDNEWTDCHREAAGGFDPLERLAKVRALHFAGAASLGAKPMPLERQSDVSEHRPMVENARWTRNGVMFATVHVVGSNNGFERTPEAAAEYFARDAANSAWIEDTYAKATAADAAGAVFAFQADLLLDTPERFDRANYGFWNTIQALSEGATAFGKPVLLIQGDTHELVIDQPLKATDGKTRLENVTRLQVMGAGEVQAVRVLVDPTDPAVFGFMPLIVPENVNRVATN
jgi:hypothetical protein